MMLSRTPPPAPPPRGRGVTPPPAPPPRGRGAEIDKD